MKGFNQRFDPSFARVREVVVAGEIGEPPYPAHHEPRPAVDWLLNDTPPPVTGLVRRIPVVMSLASAKSLAERRLLRLEEVKVKSLWRGW